MRVRYLASYFECNVSAPILGDGNRHMHFTKHLPDRGGQYCAELTRAEWDELRRVRWSSPIMEAPGPLVPDVDFVANDGKVFTDAQACLEHEASIAEAEFLKTKPQCGQEVSRLAHTQEIAGSSPATAIIQDMARLDAVAKVKAEEVRVAAQIEHLENVTTTPDAPVSIESKIINAVSSSGPMMLSVLAAKIESDPEAIKAAVKASSFLRWKGPRVALSESTIAA